MIKDIIKKNDRELVTLCVLLLIVFIFSIMSPMYMNVDNLIDIIGDATINGFLALGMTFVIITGGIDLSVGAGMAVVIVACGKIAVYGAPPALVILAGIVLGVFVGLFNGFVITKMKLQPFIATLGTCSILRGIAYLICNGYPVQNIPNNFREIFQTMIIANFSTFMFMFVIVAIICGFILKKTRIGVYTYAIGSNEEATKLSGVNTNKYKLIAYVICGIVTAIAGMIMLARLGNGEPTAGTGYELNAIAAAAIGGTSMAGGKGSILGTVFGALVLSALKDGLIIIGMNTFFQYIAIGAIIVIAAYFEIIQGTISSFILKHHFQDNKTPN